MPEKIFQSSGVKTQKKATAPDKNIGIFYRKNL